MAVQPLRKRKAGGSSPLVGSMHRYSEVQTFYLYEYLHLFCLTSRICLECEEDWTKCFRCPITYLMRRAEQYLRVPT
jgi:hypothetical protein